MKELAQRLEEFGCCLQPAQSYRSYIYILTQYIYKLAQSYNILINISINLLPAQSYRSLIILALCQILTSAFTVGKYSTKQSPMKYQEETSSTGDHNWTGILTVRIGVKYCFC